MPADGEAEVVTVAEDIREGLSDTVTVDIPAILGVVVAVAVTVG